MNTTYLSIHDILAGIECPFPIGIIPDSMGINLGSVEGVSFTRQADNQLVSLTIHFLPNEGGDEKTHREFGGALDIGSE